MSGRVNDEIRMTNDELMTNDRKMPRAGFDLEERTAVFGESVVRFCKRVKVGPVTSPLITQLVKAATSVGANYCEANDAESKPDFCHKIGICRKESKESRHFLRMLVAADATLRPQAATLWTEANQLNLIFGKILRTARKNLNIRH
jgi:four helix bundle protein